MCRRKKKSSRKRWKKGEVRGRYGSSSERVCRTEGGKNGKESRSRNKRRFITFSVCIYGFWVSRESEIADSAERLCEHGYYKLREWERLRYVMSWKR